MDKNKQPSWLELYEKKKDEFGKVNDAIMSSEFPEVRNIYIDLNCLKSTHMGTLYAFAPSVKDRAYLIANLNAFNKRLQRTFTFAYPDYPLSELDLKMKYIDPANSQQIFNYSPDTDFSINLFQFLTVIMSQNSRAGYRGPVAVHINTYPLQVTPFMKQWIQALGSSIGGYDFQLVKYSHAEMTSVYWSNFQLIILDDMLPVIQESSGIYEPLFMNGSMRNTEIYAPFQFEDKIYNKLQEDGIDLDNEDAVDAMFEYTSLMLSICCHFHYMHFNIPQPRG